MRYLYALERLSMTPSEVEHPRCMVQNVLPDPFVMPVGDDRDEGALFRRSRVATPAEARLNKRIGITTDMELFMTTVVEVLVEEWLSVAQMLKEACDMSGKGQPGPLEGNIEPPIGETGVIVCPPKNPCAVSRIPRSVSQSGEP